MTMTRRKAALLAAISVALLAAGYAVASSSPARYEEYDGPEEFEVETMSSDTGGFVSGWDQYAP